jgi:hypothetical protein
MSTQKHQPTVAELLTRIEHLEGKLAHKRGRWHRLFGSRMVGIAAGVTVVLALVGAPAFASSPAPLWGTTGNTGTTPSSNYLGTADNAGLSIRTNGTQAIGVDTSQNVTLAKNATVNGSLNAVGGLQENGTALASKYLKLDGSNAPPGGVPISITGSAGSVSANSITGVVPIANGGTGSATQNFVDLSHDQTIGGTKTFSQPIGGSITGNAATATSATTATTFSGSLSGDVTGGQSSTAVAAIQGFPVSSVPPTSGQVLTYDGTKWAPAAPASAGAAPTITQVTANAQISGFSSGTATATCPSGSIVTGGGGVGDNGTIVLGQSYPSGEGAWVAGAVNNDVVTHTLTAYALCLTP